MEKKIAWQILEKNQRDYEIIAESFSKTRKYLWPELEELTKYVKKNSQILDLGCGNGRLYELFKDKEIKYIGIDNCKKLINLAKEKYPEVEFILGDALNLPFENDRFDIIFSIAFFHHIPSQIYRLKVLKEIYRVLKPIGLLILTVWNLWQPALLLKYKIWPMVFGWRKRELDWKDVFIPWKLKNKRVIYRYYHAFTKLELRNLLKKSGFRIVECYYTRKGKKTNWLKGYNLIFVVKKCNFV